MPAYRRAKAPRRKQSTRRAAPRARTRKHKTRGLASSRTKRYSAPVALGTTRRGGGMASMSMHQLNDTCTRVVGRSYLGSVGNNPAGAIHNSDEIGLVFDINPTLLGDRLATLASTYDKYCYQSVKFTYIPQCSTAQPGSVVLAFERDPQAILANPANSAKYMQEIMSYEHAVMTPAWVETAVTYKRDPHEFKTWFMSGDQASITTRETSQGLLLAYLTAVGTGNISTGFIVMDYVLDLVSPNILPSLASPIVPTQFSRSTNACLNITAVPTGATLTEPLFYITSQTFSQGDIIEAVYCGATACTGFKYFSGTGTGGGTASAVAKINPGDKIYISVGSPDVSSGLATCIVCTNLSSALGSFTGTIGTAAGGAGATYPSGALFPTSAASAFNPFTNGGTATGQWLYWRKISTTAQNDTA